MGVMVYSLLWVMQDLYHQPYEAPFTLNFEPPGLSATGRNASLRAFGMVGSRASGFPAPSRCPLKEPLWSLMVGV